MIKRESPNPIALTCSYITYVDVQKGIIGLAYTDADNGSHILDLIGAQYLTFN